MNIEEAENYATYGKSGMEKPWFTYAKQYLPHGKKQHVLDIGCGNCGFSRILRDMGFDTHCTDINKKFIKYAKKLGFKATCADFNKPLPFKSEYFDGIACLEVIEHVPNAELVLQEANRILKPGGWMVLSTPNIAWCVWRLSSLVGKPPNNDGFHFRFFTHKTMQQKLHEAGFSVVGDSSFISIPVINGFLDSMGKRLLFPRAHIWKNFISQNIVFFCKKMERQNNRVDVHYLR